jgi:hypothetical protein
VTQVSKQFDIGLEDVGEETVACPTGTTVTGGGFWGGSLTLNYSEPDGNGWSVGVESGLFDNDHYIVYALCLKTS